MLRILAMTVVLGCLPSTALQAETPQDAAAAIAELLRERNYETLFKERYAEWHKVEEAGVEPAIAIEKKSALFEKRHAMLVALFDGLSSAKFSMGRSEMPQKSETGEVASATVVVEGEEVTYRLYKMKSGLWGFHL